MRTQLTGQDLYNYFLKGCKKSSDFHIGVEWEKLGVYQETGKAIPYSGPRGVEALFLALIKQHGWRPSHKHSPFIALQKGDSSITLEPGGQVELSGEKARHLSQNAKELHAHLNEIKSVSEPLGIVWLGLGAHPLSIAKEIQWVPKERYKIMRVSLKNKGALTFSMMKETASVQVSLDYQTERDAITKLKLGMGLSPFLGALFANSPLKQGKDSGLLSRRARIWEKTAPERTGILWDALDPGRGFQSYIDFALKVPMLFIVRSGRWVSMPNISFQQFMERGHRSHQATLEDWKLHLSGIFTEARLKNYVEIRSIDCQKTSVGLAAAALIKGIFYHPASLHKATQLLAPFTQAELQKLRHEAAKFGLKTKMRTGEKISGVCETLYRLAEEGLPKNEKKYLEPIKTYLENKKTPAETILSCFDRKKPLLGCAAIEG